MDILDQISQEVQKAGVFLVEKATVAKDYTVATWSAADIRNKINKLYQAIGLATYKARTEGAENSAEIDACIRQIEELKGALREKEDVRADLKNQKVCTSCMKGVSKAHAYCPHCGAKME